MRTVVLHYHLFKNAGTSLDRVLQRNFPDRWQSREFPTGKDDNSAQVSQWIADTPDATVFSSHTAIGPLPQVDGAKVISLMFFRNPIDRILSAYHFERTQKIDGYGANLAKALNLDGYVRTRLSGARDRQCRNFQTHRLASLLPGPEPELARALQALLLLSFVGLVDQFDASGKALEPMLRQTWPEFSFFDVHANQSKSRDSRAELNPDLQDLLAENNADDFALLAAIGNAPMVNQQA